MKILAIRFARLGDIILLLPALSALKATFPTAKLTFLTGHRCAPVGEMCPAVDEVISVDRIAMRDGSLWSALTDMKLLISDVRRRQFDLAIDFHSFRETNLLTWLSGAKQRIGMKRHNAAYLSFCFNMPPVPEDKDIHVSDMFLRMAGRLGDGVPSSRNLVIPREALEWAAQAMPPRQRLAMYVDSSGPDKTWPADRFARVADFAIEKLDASVAILSGRDRNTAAAVKESARHSSRVVVLAGLPLHRMAAVIGSSRLLISNDTGPMHFGPALGVPTLGLFSVGLPEHFRPTGPSDRVIRENPIERISVDEVLQTVGEMWTKTADPDLRY